MRIVGGTMKGRRLAGPDGDGGAARLRPTSDRMRESIFNILAHGGYTPLKDARVLDLFAGTGAMGLEALSRGAAEAVFVDNGSEARGLLAENIHALGVKDRTTLLRMNAAKLGACMGAPFSLVFCDAPYAKELTEPTMAALVAGGWLSEQATLVIETAVDETLNAPEGLELEDERRYGAGRISLFGVV